MPCIGHFSSLKYDKGGIFMITKKSVGFYIALCVAVLSAVAAVIYGVQFSKMTYKEQVFDYNISILLGATAVIAVIMLFVETLINYAPVILCVGTGISFLMYVKMIIWPVSDTIYGIEPFPYINAVIICAVLILLSFILSECSLYMKKVK